MWMPAKESFLPTAKPSPSTVFSSLPYHSLRSLARNASPASGLWEAVGGGGWRALLVVGDWVLEAPLQGCAVKSKRDRERALAFSFWSVL